MSSRILMIRPSQFGFNQETADSNAFQGHLTGSDLQIQADALAEHDRFVEALKTKGVEVMVLESNEIPLTPDAVFPNNWFSTHEDGTLVLYPMEAVSRRNERRLEHIDRIKSSFKPKRTLDYTAWENKGLFLEGTGSLVLDRQNRIAYACRSSRTNESLLSDWARQMDYETVLFDAVIDKTPIYHTNVMMAVGQSMAIICLACIPSDQRNPIKQKLIDSKKDIIELSEGQIKAFAGNMLEVIGSGPKPIWVLSQQAMDTLTENQLVQMRTHAELLPVTVTTIESIGGGSVRCMMAEIASH